MSARKLKVKGRFKKKVKWRQFPTEEGRGFSGAPPVISFKRDS